MKHNSWLYRTTASVNILSLVLQLIFPALFVLTTPASAASDPIGAKLGFDAGKNAFNLTVSTDQSVSYTLWYAHDDNALDAISGTDQATPRLEKSLYAGTCSNEACVNHQVKKGLLKWTSGTVKGAIAFTVADSVLTEKSSYGFVEQDLTPEEDAWLNKTDASPPTSSLSAPKFPVEEVCTTNSSTINSTQSDWNNPVRLGVKYVFPQNPDVTVTFSCLPKDESLRTPLKIEQVKTSDLKLPADMTNLGEYAYNITTGMENGTFAYDVTLPKSSGDASISYVEKSLDIAKNYQIGAVEVQKIGDGQTIQQEGTVKATGVDHFTIYIVSSPESGRNAPTLSTALVNDQSSVTVAPSTAITVQMSVKLEGYDSGSDWRSSQYRIGSNSWVCVNTDDYDAQDYWYGTESFSITAPATVGSYNLSLKAFTANGCTGGVSPELTMTNAIIVANTPGTLTPPTLPNNPSDTYALSSVTGVWTSIAGGSNTTGINTNEIRWGNPSGSIKSGLRFDGSGPQSFNSGTFYLGMLTHMNWKTKSGAATGARLNITLQFSKPGITPNPNFSYDFAINETANSSGDCPSWQVSGTPCDDMVTFPSSYGTQTFTIGDTQYTLVIDGFKNAYPSGTTLTQFITEEQKNNSAFLVGHLSSILTQQPAISIIKKTNGTDVTSAPGPSLTAGDTVNWSYVVQNTGNVTLTGVTVTDNPAVAITCPSTSLAAGASMICTASGTAIAGQFTNTATVRGTPPTGANVTASDSSWYFGTARIFCGDGIRNGTEQCDDGNSVNNDSCTNACTTPRCGDAIVNGTDACDDGNSVNNDSCTNSCTVPRCGDAIVNGTDQCDDGNSVNTDACTNACTTPRCGDMIVNGTDACDDGNLVNNDACSNSCTINACGDGVVNQASEQCDRGASNTDIACVPNYNSSCSYCTSACQTTSVTGPYCGDGIINGSETCDGTNLGSNPSSDFRCNSCSLELITPKVTICHASSSQSNPYVSNEPNKSGDVSGHAADNGPVWYPGINVTWGDIIPPFYYVGGYFSGLNWTTAGQSIWNDGCNVPKGTLTVKKVIVGSSVSPSTFSFSVNSTAAQSFEADGQNDISVNPGTYTVTESANNDYVTTYNNCSGITVAKNSSTTCTITNTKKASLTVTKVVTNDNGGTKQIVDFPLFVNNIAVTSGAANLYVPGTYSVTETGDRGYAASYSANCANGSITLAAGESKTCTITNNDIQPKLTVTKVVENKNVGTAKVSDFPLFVGSTSVTSGTQAGFNAGTYTVSETNQPGYTAAFAGDCDVTGGITLNVGDVKTCTIINTRDTALLTVIKQVIGSTALPRLWTMHITQNSTDVVTPFLGSLTGSTYTVGTGTYSVSETGSVLGYTLTYGNDCDSTGSVTLGKGDTKTCRLINTRDTGTLVAHKFEDNNANRTQDSGESNLSGWDMNLYRGSNCTNYLSDVDTDSSGNASFGTLVTGEYSVRETLKSGWKNTTSLCQNITVSKNTLSTVNFGNYHMGSVTIKKVTNPGSMEVFTYRGTLGTHTFYNNDSDTYNNLEIGTYTITEDAESGWYLNDLVCDQGTVSVANRTASIALAANMNATCTFSNTKYGLIHGEKFNDLNGNNRYDLIPYESFLNGWRIFLDSNNNGMFDAGERSDVTSGSVFGVALGDYSFDNIVPGDYRICEEMQTGWSPTTGTNCQTTTVHAGDIDILQFANRQLGNISVQKFEDLNGNATKDTNETGGKVDGWTMSIYQGTTCSGTTLLSQATDASGVALFEKLIIGSYSVKETTDPGWQNTTGACRPVTVTAGNTATVYVGNQRNYVNVTVSKTDDIDPAVAGEAVTYTIPWSVESNGGATVRLVENVLTTNPIDYTSLTTLNPDWYICGTAYCKDLGSLTSGTHTGTASFKVTVLGTAVKGDHIDNTVTVAGTYYSTTGPNTPIAEASDDEVTTITASKVTVHKYNDDNGNGVRDEDERYMSGWTINLAPIEQQNSSRVTNSDGVAEFSSLAIGGYVLSETIQTGWTQTNIACNQDREQGITTDNSYSLSLARGEEVTCEIGNQFIPPELQVEKYNDRWPNAQAPSSDVHYTIVLHVLKNNVYGAQVTDLLPQGVVYRPGSYQAVSSIHGLLSIGEPTYHSPGVWTLPSLQKDEVITLTYTADLTSDIKAGTFKDLAWAYGSDDLEGYVLASAIATSQSSDPGVVTDSFVGTRIIVDRSLQYGYSVNMSRTEQRGGAVLGATTELPATGQNGLIAVAGILLIVAGGALQIVSRKNRRHHV